MKTNNNAVLYVSLINFLTCFSFYLVTPLLPIYFVESIANGGLGWSKATTCSLYGTFLSALYILPCGIGFLGSTLLKKGKMEILGYTCAIAGMISIALGTTPSEIRIALLILSIGMGSIKVRLAALLGSIPKETGHKAFDFLYNTSCLGFVSGAIISPYIFSCFSIKGVVIVSLFGTAASAFANFFFLSDFRIKQPEKIATSDSQFVKKHVSFFSLLLLISIPFFTFLNQIMTSIPIFIHQTAHTTIGGFTIPALWFGALGSLLVTIFSPYLRKKWLQKNMAHENIIFIKCAYAFLVASLSFFFLQYISQAISSSFPHLYSVISLVTVHILLYIADLHMRPTLLFASALYTPEKWRSLASGIVYACIGLGGKFAGMYASQVDALGFNTIFFIAGLILLSMSGILFLSYKLFFTRPKTVPLALNP